MNGKKVRDEKECRRRDSEGRGALQAVALPLTELRGADGTHDTLRVRKSGQSKHRIAIVTSDDVGVFHSVRRSCDHLLSFVKGIDKRRHIEGLGKEAIGACFSHFFLMPVLRADPDHSNRMPPAPPADL